MGVNALVSAALIALAHLWLVPERLPALAVLDVAELYRLKELQVAAVLVKRDASDEERAGALRRAAGFGTEVSTLLQALPGEVPLHRAGAWRRDGLRTPAARPDAGRAAPARPVAASGVRMRTLFLHRSWRDRFASSGRFRLRTFAERSVEHLKHWAVVYVAIAAIALWFHAHYGFGLERLAQPAAPALPHPQGEMPSRGDFVAFRWAGGGPYPAGVTFIKVLAGMPGDEVTRDAQGFHLNGVPVGVPKPVSRQGQVLEPGPTGRIPEGRYYVQAGHPTASTPVPR